MDRFVSITKVLKMFVVTDLQYSQFVCGNLAVLFLIKIELNLLNQHKIVLH
jgi:hypothetical protein